jgi:hypothetical protein
MRLLADRSAERPRRQLELVLRSLRSLFLNRRELILPLLRRLLVSQRDGCRIRLNRNKAAVALRRYAS